MKEKIPVRITWIKNEKGKVESEVLIGLEHVFDGGISISKKIEKFKKRYIELVKKSQKIMPKDKSKRKTSHFWKIGKLLYDFNKSIENEFEITNYQQAVIRDFGLYDRSQVGHIIQFGEFFKKKDISDEISMSTYLELIWKANLLKKAGNLEKEKKRLLRRAKDKTLSPHKEYRKELNALIKSKSLEG